MSDTATDTATTDAAALAAATADKAAGTQTADSTKTTDTSTASADTQTDKTTDTQADKPQGAPEKYEAFTLPDGVVFHDDAIKSLQDTAKELNLDQKGAQRLADLRASEVQAFTAAQAKMITEAQATWAEEAKADPVLGGEKYDANVGAAKGALTVFGSEGLTKFLEDSGLASHPEMLKLGLKLSAYVGEDNKIIAGARPQSVAKSFYDHPSSKAK